MRTKLESLTAREREEMQFHSEERALERIHVLEVRKLDLVLQKEANRIAGLLKLPKLIIMLPVIFVLALAVVVRAGRGKDIKEELESIFK